MACLMSLLIKEKTHSFLLDFKCHGLILLKKRSFCFNFISHCHCNHDISDCNSWYGAAHAVNYVQLSEPYKACPWSQILLFALFLHLTSNEIIIIRARLRSKSFAVDLSKFHTIPFLFPQFQFTKFLSTKYLTNKIFPSNQIIVTHCLFV